jgi:fluoride exporter
VTTALLVALGAALGAPARWALDRAVQARHGSRFPWGTFVVNVSGSLALGVLLGLVDGGSSPLVAVLGTGFLGAFTTYSTFAVETLRLVEGRATRVALANVVLSVAAGTAAALAGWFLGVAATG